MSGFRVLLVDDEEELVSTLVERLDYRGISAEYAIEGRAALGKLREKSYDVMVIDLKLPGMSGEELLRTIRASYPELPVLMMTGHGSGERQEMDKLDGVYDFLLKPVDISELVIKMKEAIKANEPQQP